MYLLHYLYFIGFSHYLRIKRKLVQLKLNLLLYLATSYGISNSVLFHCSYNSANCDIFFYILLLFNSLISIKVNDFNVRLNNNNISYYTLLLCQQVLSKTQCKISKYSLQLCLLKSSIFLKGETSQ